MPSATHEILLRKKKPKKKKRKENGPQNCRIRDKFYNWIKKSSNPRSS